MDTSVITNRNDARVCWYGLHRNGRDCTQNCKLYTKWHMEIETLNLEIRTHNSVSVVSYIVKRGCGTHVDHIKAANT